MLSEHAYAVCVQATPTGIMLSFLAFSMQATLLPDASAGRVGQPPSASRGRAVWQLLPYIYSAEGFVSEDFSVPSGKPSLRRL